MKNIIVTASVLFALNTHAQQLKETNVPASVKEAFKKQYPEIKKMKWEKEKDNYEVEFETKNVETSVVFDLGGKMIQTEQEIPVSELPKSVSEYLAKNLAGKKINETAKITDAAGTITYEVEIDKTDYIFDVNGNLVNKGKEDTNMDGN